MSTYATHELARIRQHDLMAEADRARLVKEARLASRATGAPARPPLIWLREAVGGFAAQLVTLSRVHARGH